MISRNVKAGWLIVFVSTFHIDHFDLFGLRQVTLYVRGKAYTPLPFKAVGFYRYVRHPIMLGFVVAFWGAPTMSVGRLLFSAMTTAYILVAVQLEERDLVRYHGEAYTEYKRRTSMLIPFTK